MGIDIDIGMTIHMDKDTDIDIDIDVDVDIDIDIDVDIDMILDIVSIGYLIMGSVLLHMRHIISGRFLGWKSCKI